MQGVLYVLCPQKIYAYFIKKQSMASIQVFFSEDECNNFQSLCCSKGSAARHKERLTDVSRITASLWTQSNSRSVAGAKEIDIAATLEHLRDQRAGMVQTKVSFPGFESEDWGRGEAGTQGGQRGFRRFRVMIVCFIHTGSEEMMMMLYLITAFRIREILLGGQ